MGRPKEPLLWALFSAGGTVAALILPSLFFVLWIAIPLGWLAAPSHGELLGIVSHPLTRLVLFGVVGLSLFHWAHRFRYTLYDGLQLYHLNRLIALLTYGVATVVTLAAGYTVAALL